MILAEGTVAALDTRGRGRLVVGEHRLRVPGTDVGERVRVHFIDDPRGRPQVVRLELLEGGAGRVDPECPQAGYCPGCPLRHLSRARQLELKAGWLRRALRQACPHAEERIDTVRWSPLADGVRLRSVAAALLDGEGHLVLGMRPRRGPSLAAPIDAPADPLAVVDLSRCPLHHPQVNAALRAAADALQAQGWRPWDRDAGTGSLRWVKAHASSAHGPRVGLVTLPGASPASEALLAQLTVGGGAMGVVWEAPARRGHATDSFRVQVLRPPERVELRVGAWTLEASPGAWTPVSLPAAELLLGVVLDLLSAPPPESVLEVGCGVGSLSLPLAARHGRVLGVDASRAAVLDAQRNAAATGICDARFRVGWADRALRRLVSGSERFDAAILHGMRRSYGASVLGLLPALGVQRLLCVSPSMGSLARDLAAAAALGWRVQRVVPVEQLPHTPHLLGAALLRRG